MVIKSHTIQLSFFVRPIICGAIASLIWYALFFRTGLHIPKEETAIVSGVLPFLGIWHAIVTGLIITKVWTEYVEMQDAVHRKDKKKFERLRRCRIPLVIRTFLLILSVLIQTLFSIIDYSEMWVGLVSTFVIGTVLVMFWEVAYNLDNPVKAVWYRELVPMDWFFVDESGASGESTDLDTATRP